MLWSYERWKQLNMINRIMDAILPQKLFSFSMKRLCTKSALNPQWFVSTKKKSPMIWCINEGGEEQKAWLFLLICCYHYLTWVLRNLNYSITEPASVTKAVQISLSWCQHGRNHQSCKGEGYNFSVVWFHENEKKQKGKQRDPGYEKTQGKRQKEERNPTAPHPTFFFFYPCHCPMII